MKSLILLVLTLCCFITGDKTAPVAMGNTALLDNKYLYVNSSEYGGGFYKDDDMIYYANVYDMRKLYAYDIAKDEAVLLVDDIIRVLYIRVYDDVIYFTGISLSKDYENYGDIIFKVNYSIFKVNKDARQQHLLFRKNNIKQNLRIEGSLKHHFLFTETPILCLINQSKGSFT